MENDIGRSW